MSKIAGKFSLISERNKGPKLVIKPFKLAVQASCLMLGDKTRRVTKGKGGGVTPFPSLIHIGRILLFIPILSA